MLRTSEYACKSNIMMLISLCQSFPPHSRLLPVSSARVEAPLRAEISGV